MLCTSLGQGLYFGAGHAACHPTLVLRQDFGAVLVTQLLSSTCFVLDKTGHRWHLMKGGQRSDGLQARVRAEQGGVLRMAREVMVMKWHSARLPAAAVRVEGEAAEHRTG